MTTSEREVILRIDHITKRFPLEGGKVLTACDDVTFPVYRGRDPRYCRRERLRKEYAGAHIDAAASAVGGTDLL